MVYNVTVSPDAKTQIKNILNYLSINLQNTQAARGVQDEIRQTYVRLTHITDGFPPRHKFKSQGVKYYIIKLKKHRYLMVYHFENNKIYIDGIYHNSQNYRKLL